MSSSVSHMVEEEMAFKVGDLKKKNMHWFRKCKSRGRYEAG